MDETAINLANEAAESAINLMFQVKFELIGAKLFAAFQKIEDTMYLIVAPSTPQDSKKIGLGDLVKSVASIFSETGNQVPPDLSEDKLQDSLTSIGGVADKIQFQLKMAYFLIKMGGTVPDKEMEYAFDLEVTSEDDIGLGELIKFESISFAVWNTTKEKILEKMNITDMYKLLEANSAN